MSQSPQTGQVYFNMAQAQWYEAAVNQVTIPSNGSSLFQFKWVFPEQEKLRSLSQSPQTGQVYFNMNLLEVTVISQFEVTIPSNGSSLFQ